MPLQVFCRNCAQYRQEWCDLKVNSPDPDMVRDCQYYKEKSNADRIRAKSDEELAAWIELIVYCRSCPFRGKQCDGEAFVSRIACQLHWLDWLKKGADV